MKLRPSRAIFCLVLVLMVSTVLGGLFGGQVRATTTKGEDDVDNSLKLFSNLLGLVEENYASDVDSDRAVYGAIDGMIRALDPPCRFFDSLELYSFLEVMSSRSLGIYV